MLRKEIRDYLEWLWWNLELIVFGCSNGKMAMIVTRACKVIVSGVW